MGGIESDTTGLTHLGVGGYDPTIGRFVSLDPVLELTDPQQVNGYSYAAGNPITGADPDAKDTVSGYAHALASLKQAFKDIRHGHSAQVLGNLVGMILLAAATDKVTLDLGVIKQKPRGCSFSPDAEVLMDGGKTKPIGKIKPGDEVEAADPDTGKHQKAEKVTATWINHDDDLVDLTIDTGSDHASVLHTTSKHPFWDDTLHKWLPAAQLTPGHALETATNTHVCLAGKTTHPGTATCTTSLSTSCTRTMYSLGRRRSWFTTATVILDSRSTPRGTPPISPIREAGSAFRNLKVAPC